MRSGDNHKMNHSFCFVSIIILLTNLLGAQEHHNMQRRPEGSIDINLFNEKGEHRRRALVLEIDARVLENEQDIIWSESHKKITIPGTPVGIQLLGSNLAVAVQFTPFIRRHGSVLVAQVQIGINNPDSGLNLYTSIQTIPIEFNEPVYFFPLGQAEGSSSIEILLTVYPHREDTIEAITNKDND